MPKDTFALAANKLQSSRVALHKAAAKDYDKLTPAVQKAVDAANAAFQDLKKKAADDEKRRQERIAAVGL